VSATSRLRVLAAPLQGGGALVRDYLAGRDLGRFYVGHPADPGSYVRKAAEVDARLNAQTRSAVRPAIEPLGDSADRLNEVLAGHGYFVTTGQQPALFGGPLYTLYKILAAIRLADSLERRLDRPVLALFWVGSDDHDWAEANHATILDSGGYPHRITVAAAADEPALPLSERVWGRGVARAAAELIDQLPRGGWSDAVADHVRSAYVADVTVAASFMATIRFLLHDRRLAIVESAHPAIRRAAAPVLRHDVAHAAEHAQRTAERTAQLVDAGYSAQVAVPEDASNVMLIDTRGRDRLVRTRSGWATRRGQRMMTDAELQHRMEAEPERFTPNVLLRPVVESALFPTLAYVAGPGEISYFAQIGSLFDAHGIMPPVVVPRPSVTLVEPAIARTLDRLGMAAAEFNRPFDTLLTDMIRQQLPSDVARALDTVREGLYSGYAQLIDAAIQLDPTLRGPLVAARNAALVRAYDAEKKIVTHMKRRGDVFASQLRRTAAALHPTDAPQERVLNVLPFAARWGADLVDAIEAALHMEPAPARAAAGRAGDA
jgi:bacillithiol synthase